MAETSDNNSEKKTGAVRVKAGVLPGVREIRRPDFTRKAADIEKAEAERVLTQGDSNMAEIITEGKEDDSNEELDASAVTTEPHWYVAHTYSGYENKVMTNLRTTIQNRHLEDQIFDVMIPMQDSVEMKTVTDKDDGSTHTVKKVVPRKMFPGYVLVKMIMNNDTWYVVRNTRGVTGFVGPGSKPVPLSENDIKPLGIRTQNVSVDFGVGDMITVVAGVWKDTMGPVQKIDFNKQTVTINVELFGRETPVEISFAEVRKSN